MAESDDVYHYSIRQQKYQYKYEDQSSISQPITNRPRENPFNIFEKPKKNKYRYAKKRSRNRKWTKK